MKAKESKPYILPEDKADIVEEPFVMYGVIDLDVTKRYTYADYLTWLDDRRRELINGFIHLMSAPRTEHARITSNLNFLLKSYIKKKKGRCMIFHAPFDVRLPKNSETADNKIYDVVQPDVCMICDPAKIDEKGCIGAPDLVVEVLSLSTLKYDWNYKFNLYETSGVGEYWIIDPKTKIVYVFLLQPGGMYDMGTVYEPGRKIPVQALKGLEIDVNELFEES